MSAALLTHRLLRGWPLPDPQEAEGKEERGRVLVVGGSRRIPGALLLAAEAALRAGAGKLQAATATSVACAVAVALPEAKVMALREDAHGEPLATAGEVVHAAAAIDALVLGPGLLPGASTARLVHALLVAATEATVAVCDAGALAPALEERKARCARVLTPHAGEMASLLGVPLAKVQAAPALYAASLAHESRTVVVLKGATTWIAAPDGRQWVNRGGSVGLGTSGSGDVLAGLIGGLAARGAAPEQAAAWGVWLHARAGARLSRRYGAVGFLAREIGAEVPDLMR
jgi:hydroxyethylthiazole kinase-like uncharacterized protein yjeF